MAAVFYLKHGDHGDFALFITTRRNNLSVLFCAAHNDMLAIAVFQKYFFMNLPPNIYLFINENSGP